MSSNKWLSVLVKINQSKDYKSIFYVSPSKREQRESVTAAILAAAREAREKLLKKHPKQMVSRPEYLSSLCWKKYICSIINLLSNVTSTSQALVLKNADGAFITVFKAL